jgi:hypothetical protein
VASSYILARLNAIEHELSEIRRHLASEKLPPRESRSLYGVIKGVEFSEEEIEKVSRELQVADGE